MSDEHTPQSAGDKLNIELSEEVADGEYSNLAIISHSNSEFVLELEWEMIARLEYSPSCYHLSF